MREINRIRNLIVHAGHFNEPEEARQVIETTRQYIHGLVHLYDPSFVLADQKKRPTE
jgi:hypothetical protein